MHATFLSARDLGLDGIQLGLEGHGTETEQLLALQVLRSMSHSR